MAHMQSNADDLTWQGCDLPTIPPGDYQATCIKWQGPVFLRNYRRWSLRLEFDLVAERCSVSAFFNMGNDPKRPNVGRRSRFYAAWTQANGEPPHKGQRMQLETFTDPSLLYIVRVSNSVKDEHENNKPQELVYSRVQEIVRIDRP